MHKTIRTILLCAIAAALAACAQSNHSLTQAAQERSACAELGLDPGSGAFGNCVGNLDATITAYNSGAYR